MVSLKALAGCFDRRGAESIDVAGSGTGWELEAVGGAGTLADAPMLPLPTYS